MEINIKLLEQCPELSDYQKDLIKRVDVDGESQISVARLYKKSRSTICSQIKKARKKLVGWMKKHESPAEANLDKYVFGRLNRGDSPKVIIADAGHSDEIIKLSEKWRKLHDDDYWAAWNVLNSYSLMQGFEEEEKPLAKAVESLIDWLEDGHQDLNEKTSENENLKLQLEDLNNKRLQQLENLNSKLSNVSNELDEAEAEIERLSRLRKYEGLTDEQIQVRRKTLHMLDTAIDKQSGRLSNLNLQVDTAKCVIFDLHTKTRETIKEYLAGMSVEEMWKFIIDAKWGKTNPLMARVLKSTVT